MPLYDFRCAECRIQQDVQASMSEADSLELLCFACGGSMRKAISRTVGLILSSSGSGPSPSSAPKRKRPTCADGSVKLKEPNPFRAELPAAQAAAARKEALA